jgi:hypothetical protein
MNTGSRPLNRYLLSAKAAIELTSSVNAVATTVMKTVFQRYEPKLNFPIRSV